MTTTNSAAAGQGNTDTGAADKAAADAAAATAATAAAEKATSDAAAVAAAAEAGKASTDAAAVAAAAAAGAKKAPEKYELAIPEKSTIDAGDVKMIETIAREQGWSNDEAQAALERHNDSLIEQSARFLADTKADQVWGGDNLAKTQADAKAVLDRVEPATTPEGKALRALLDKSGYGNHIRVVSFLAKLGRMMAEDSPGQGGGGAQAGAAKSTEDTLYDNTKLS